MTESITDFLRKWGVEFRPGGTHHHVREGWVGLDCLRCGPGSGKFKLGLNLLTGGMTCWTCGWFPTVPTLMELTGRSYGECKEALGGSLPSLPPPKEKVRGELTIPQGVGPLLDVHARYLKGRGFDPEAISRLWGVLGIGLAPRLQWRLFIPVVVGGEVVSWTTRAVGDAPGLLRYVGAGPGEEKVSKKETLYGLDYVRHAVVVHEGPTDVWRTGPGAVATMGVGYTRRQVLLLSRVPVRVICFDSEVEAQERAKRLCAELSVFPGTTVRVELDSPDPGCAAEDEVKYLRGFLD